MTADMTVFIVDDDRGALRSMRWLLESEGFEVQEYSSGEEFVRAYVPAQGGCLLLDLQMPDMNGLKVQQWLVDRNSRLPVIFLTGHGDVGNCAQAMKAGAFDFLEKPIDDASFIELVHNALEESHRRLRVEAAHPEIAKRLQRLTPRETEVLQHLRDGKSMKVMAGVLGITIQTVAKHRTRVLEKMVVNNETELVRLLAQFERN